MLLLLLSAAAAAYRVCHAPSGTVLSRRMEFIAVGLAILFTIATSVPLGGYIARVFRGERTLWIR